MQFKATYTLVIDYVHSNCTFGTTKTNKLINL